MLERVVAWFSRRHLLGNFVVVTVLAAGVYFWRTTVKEEMPDISFNIVRVSVAYPGATPEEVEHAVTRPLEDSLRGVEGIRRLESSSSAGAASLTVELQPKVRNLDAAVNDIRNAVLSVALPEEVRDKPRVWLVRTTRRPVLDVALVDTERRLLDDAARRRLQAKALALEGRLAVLPEVGEIRRTGWLQREMRVEVQPERLRRYNLSLSAVVAKLRQHNLRQPAGALEDDRESRVTVRSPLYTAAELAAVPLQMGFEGQGVRLGDVAEVSERFEKPPSIVKVNGHEAVILNCVKAPQAGVLDAVDRIREVCARFERENLAGTGLKILFMRDGSAEVRNRLSIIQGNAAIGFALVLAVLFVFMDFRSGLWVAAGIPFSFCFAMAAGSLMGLTINNMTLAAAIIVMGMVVDDAIVIAEEITRREASGEDEETAAVKGTARMLLPVVGSVATTMVAFLPFLLAQGRYMRMVQVLPPVIWLVLGASLLESVLILPGHMRLRMPRRLLLVLSLGLLPLLERLTRGRDGRGHWFFAVEDVYGKVLRRVLAGKAWLFLAFALMLAGSAVLLSGMRYVMFPNEEATEVRLMATAPEGTKRWRTAELAQGLEDALAPYLGKEVRAFRTDVGRTRWGGAAEENRLTMFIEVVPRWKRTKSLNELVREWETALASVPGFKEVRFSRQAFGSSTGSAIELVFSDNDDRSRMAAVQEVFRAMSADPRLENVEIERTPPTPEYVVSVDRKEAERLGVDVSRVALTLRSALAGTVLYDIPAGDEDIPLRVTVPEAERRGIREVLRIPVENQGRYLVPLGSLVTVRQGMATGTIVRENRRRVTRIFADIAGSPAAREKRLARRQAEGPASADRKPEAAGERRGPERKTSRSAGPTNARPKGRLATPLEVAESYERGLLAELARRYPTTVVSFAGEVRDSRESGTEFRSALWLVLLLVYMILALLFDSLTKPLVVLLSAPFGVVGVVLAFRLHGFERYGFFAVVGVLGLLGVVVNDAIVMVSKLDERFREGVPSDAEIAEVAKTRLRAVTLTTLTTVAGLFPTAYGWAGYDGMLAELMLAMGWGLLFSTLVTLFLVPAVYSVLARLRWRRTAGAGLAAVLAAVALLPSPLRAERLLGREEFLERVRAAHPSFGVFLVDALNAEYGKALKRPASDLVLQVAARRRLAEGAETSVAASAALPLASTGLGLSARWDAVLSERSVSSVEAGVTMAVLRNLFGRAERLQARSAELETELAVYKVWEAFEDYEAMMAGLWYDWYEARLRLDAARRFHRESVRLLEQVRQRRRRGVADGADLARAELQELERRDGVLTASNLWMKVTERIREVSGVTDTALRPGPLVVAAFPEGPFERLWEAATNGRTWRTLALMRKKSLDDLALLKENLLPSVELGVYYARTFREGPAQVQASSDGPGVRVSLSLPPYRRVVASWRIGEGEARRTELSARASAAAYRTAVANLHRDLLAERELLRTAEAAAEAAGRLAAEERRNYDMGRIPLSQYLAAVGEGERRRLERDLRAVSLERRKLDWLRLTDALLPDRAEGGRR